MLTNRLRQIFQHWHEMREVNAMSDLDLADLGLTRDQLAAFVMMPPEVDERLGQMATVFGVDIAAIRQHYADYLDLLQTCESCGAVSACQKALATPGITAESCSFCPNAPAYREAAGLVA